MSNYQLKQIDIVSLLYIPFLSFLYGWCEWGLCVHNIIYMVHDFLLISLHSYEIIFLNHTGEDDFKVETSVT